MMGIYDLNADKTLNQCWAHRTTSVSLCCYIQRTWAKKAEEGDKFFKTSKKRKVTFAREQGSAQMLAAFGT